MKKIKRIKDNITLHPIMTICFLILFIIVLSGILTLFNVSASYNKVSYNGSYVKEFIFPENLFSLSGIKFIFSNAVSNFASFTPLSILIITFVGFGIMEKSGFLDSFFHVLTKKSSKKAVTFVLSLICILSSIGGDISFIILLPISALLFKYGKRNPRIGIVCAFANIATGIGINLLMNSIDSAMLEYTLSASTLFVSSYTLSAFFHIIIMFIAAISMALINTNITERIIVTRVGHYEHLDEKEDYLTKKEKRGLALSLIAGSLYILIFIYNIIPYAPLGGNLLDYSQKLYIDKLFGYNSFFNQGFVFVVTLLFFILGITYGLATKTIKNQNEIFDSLGYSLNKIGKCLVLMFFASSLIFIFKKSNIGPLITAGLASFIANSNFSGITLIMITFVISALATIFLPNTINKWSILSASIVPVFMNTGLSPAFASVVFRAGECVTYGLTPLMAYFVIYIAMLDMYKVEESKEGIFRCMKYITPYAGFAFIMWTIILIAFYLIGLPLGVGATPGL